MLAFIFGGTKIRIYFGFFAMICFYFYLYDSDSAGIGMALTACFLHELGHLTAMMALSERPRAICLYCGGLKIIPPYDLIDRPKKTVILAAGCAVNLVIAAIALPLGAYSFLRIHLATGMLNLLPFKALDGGKLLMLYLPESVRRAFAVAAASILISCIAAVGGSPIALLIALYAAAAEFIM